MIQQGYLLWVFTPTHPKLKVTQERSSASLPRAWKAPAPLAEPGFKHHRAEKGKKRQMTIRSRGANQVPVGHWSIRASFVNLPRYLPAEPQGRAQKYRAHDTVFLCPGVALFRTGYESERRNGCLEADSEYMKNYEFHWLFKPSYPSSEPTH